MVPCGILGETGPADSALKDCCWRQTGPNRPDPLRTSQGGRRRTEEDGGGRRRTGEERRKKISENKHNKTHSSIKDIRIIQYIE